jgi:hypothetical protein
MAKAKKTETAKGYKVLSRIMHDGETVEAGALIDIDAETAAPLIDAGVLDAKPVAAAAEPAA